MGWIYLLPPCRRSATVVDSCFEQILKGHAMHKMSKKVGPLELADLILKHDPGASLGQISNVISEWGDLFDDQKFSADESTDSEGAAPKGKPQSRH
jgi:hypothetical protein